MVKQSSNLKIIELGEIMGVKFSTVKSYFTNPTYTSYKQPPINLWNLLLYELHARQLGYNNLDELVAVAEPKKRQYTKNQ